MNLPSPKSTRSSKRVGRGFGTGKGGHTAGRGTKGQKSRSGYKKPRQGFEGGQNPLSKRLPKLRGLSNAARTNKFKTAKIVNTPIQLSTLDKVFNSGDVINKDSLIENKIIKPLSHKVLNVKVVFDGDIKKKLNFEGIKMSATAKASVEKAGGKVS